MNVFTSKESILSYPITSCNMYYTAEGERTIYLQDILEADTLIYGENPTQGAKSSTNLAVILLELAMSLDAHEEEDCTPVMDDFGKKIGDAIVYHIYQVMPKGNPFALVSYGIESILHSMDTEFTYEPFEHGRRYELIRCPLCLEERRSGILNETCNAHRILHSIFQDIIQKIAPSLVLEISKNTLSDHEIILFAEP